MIANNSTFALSDTKDYETMEMIQKPEIWRPDLLQLCKSYPNSTLYFDYPLSRETYFGIGGNASVYLEINQVNLLTQIAKFKTDYGLDTFILGRGSNLLVSDTGFRGIVIRLTGQLRQLTIENDLVHAAAGASQAKLAKSAARHGLSGVEFALGIPGSVGGGLIMNAGAWDSDFSQIVQNIRVVTNRGEIVDLTTQQAQFEYRKSKLDNFFCVIQAELKLAYSDPRQVTKKMKDFYQKKIQTQPFVSGNAGCMFKNPDGYSAGWLIDHCGLKGTKVGGAEISTMHANFIINHGYATSRDVFKLIEVIQLAVKDKFGIDLQLEVKLLGF